MQRQHDLFLAVILRCHDSLGKFRHR
jgi:hypothetical protein